MNKNKKTDQTIVGHLTEVRRRIILSILAFVITTILVFQYTEPIVQDLIAKSNGMNFVFIEPTELFITFITIALISGLVVALPFLLFQLWLFIVPGLKKNEKTGLALALTVGLLLFAIGSAFAYIIVVPMTTRFFMSFQLSNIPPMISFRSYFNYTLSLVLSFGMAFEFPILIIILSSIGIMKSSFLAKQRKYVLLIVLIVAAIITPPDVVSQVLITIPLMILFEIGIFVGKKVEKRRDKKKKTEESSIEQVNETEKIEEKNNDKVNVSEPQVAEETLEPKVKSVKEQIRELVESGELTKSEDEKF